VNHERISEIGHGEMPFHNPIGEDALDALIDLLPLEPGDAALDVGCGRGELLIRIAEVTGAHGFGLDASDAQISAARHEAALRVPAAELVFETRDAGTLVAPAGSFAVAACVGSTHALGGLEATLRRLSELVRPGGYVLIGEGYWPRPPAADELEALGAAEDELGDLPGLLAAGDAHGLTAAHLRTATGEDWERYEWTYIFNLDRYAAEHPDEAGMRLVHDRVASIRRRRLLAAVKGEALGFAVVAWRSS